MPELPEVETTRRGLEPLIVNKNVLSAHIYKRKLRWEIPSHLIQTLKKKTIQNEANNLRTSSWKSVKNIKKLKCLLNFVGL